MLAKHGRRLLNLLDDTPVVPGDTRPAFEGGSQSRQILNDAEEDLREWQPSVDPVTSSANQMTSTLMPASSTTAPSEVGDGASSVPASSVADTEASKATTATPAATAA